MPGEKKVRIELGRRRLDARDAAVLEAGSIVALEATVSDEVDVYVNGKLHACGQPVVVDGKLGVRVTRVFEETTERQA
jgi:flagellar motor switch/type III secretory pathway protein FliN